MPKQEADDDFETAVRALARMKGLSPADLKRQMLEAELLGGASKPAPPPPADQPVRQPLTRRADDRAARDEVDESGETPAEAQERWYREEAELVDGVLGVGGSSGGGIFGDGPIATAGYDPLAEQRGESRVFAAHQARLFDRFTAVLERVETRLGAPAPRGALEGAVPPRRRLGR